MGVGDYLERVGGGYEHLWTKSGAHKETILGRPDRRMDQERQECQERLLLSNSVNIQGKTVQNLLKLGL